MSPTLPSISTAAELNQHLGDGSTTLVCIDIEGDWHNTSEIGLAICSHLQPLKIGHSYASFVEENQISCSTITLRESTPHHQNSQERLRFGEDAHGVDENFESTISGHLRRQASSNLILALFDSRSEMKWVTRCYPTLLDHFTAYVDVQRFANNASNNRRPLSLRECLIALDINEGVPVCRNKDRLRKPHRAANDVVYTLATLASLLSRPSDAALLKIAQNAKSLVLIYGRPWPKRMYPYTVLIRTIDRTPLPPGLDSAGKVYSFFSSFNPITAGTGLTHNPRTRPEYDCEQLNRSFEDQLSRSWICFGNRVDLDAFVLSMNHATVGGGKKIVVERFYVPGVTLANWEERKAKQLEDGDRIREERRKLRLLSDTPVCN